MAVYSARHTFNQCKSGKCPVVEDTSEGKDHKRFQRNAIGEDQDELTKIINSLIFLKYPI